MRSVIDLTFALTSRSRIDEAVRSTGSKLMRGIYPRDARNGATFVVAEVLALLENSAIGRRSTQSS